MPGNVKERLLEELCEEEGEEEVVKEEGPTPLQTCCFATRLRITNDKHF